MPELVSARRSRPDDDRQLLVRKQPDTRTRGCPPGRQRTSTQAVCGHESVGEELAGPARARWWLDGGGRRRDRAGRPAPAAARLPAGCRPSVDRSLVALAASQVLAGVAACSGRACASLESHGRVGMGAYKFGLHGVVRAIPDLVNHLPPPFTPLALPHAPQDVARRAAASTTSAEPTTWRRGAGAGV